MGEEPDRIRAEIEETRAQMGETSTRSATRPTSSPAPRSTYRKKDSAKESIVGRQGEDRRRGDRTTVSERRRTPSRSKARRARPRASPRRTRSGSRIGAVAVGFIAGMLIPSTRVEDEKLGPVADDVKEKAKETGQEALEHGKQVAQDAAQSAQETLKESGQQHAQEVKETAQTNAQQATPSSY